MRRAAMRLLTLGTLLTFGTEATHAFYASLDAKTVSNKKWKEATIDDQGRRVVEEKQTQTVDAKIHVFKNEGKSVKVQCYFFAKHPSEKGPYLFDVQEQTVYGAGTVSFTSPDVTRSETRSQSFKFQGYLDPFGIRLPFEGTAKDSTKSRGARLYGWVVVTVVDAVIEQVKSNQSGLGREFEEKSRAAKIAKSKESNSTTRPNSVVNDSFQKKLELDYGSWKRGDGFSSSPAIRPASTATLIEPTKVVIRRNGVKVGETTAPAGAQVKVLEKKDERSLVQYGATEPIWVAESQLAKE